MSSNKPTTFEEYINNELKISEFAWWDWHIPTNKVQFNDLKVKWLGYAPKDFQNKGYEAFTALLHPEDYERAMDAMREYLSGQEKLYKIDYRIKDISGEYKWYLDRGIAVSSDKHKKPVRLRGLVINMGNFFSQEIKNEAIIKQIREVIPFKSTTGFDHFTVCCNCKKLKIREHEYIDFKGNLDEIIDVPISHSLCSQCIESLYPEMEDLE